MVVNLATHPSISSLITAEVVSSLVECSLVQSLAKLLTSTDISPENVSNALVLVESCSKSGERL